MTTHVLRRALHLGTLTIAVCLIALLPESSIAATRYRVAGDGVKQGESCPVLDAKGQKIGELRAGTVIEPYNVLKTITTFSYKGKIRQVPTASLVPLTASEETSAKFDKEFEATQRAERLRANAKVAEAERARHLANRRVTVSKGSEKKKDTEINVDPLVALGLLVGLAAMGGTSSDSTEEQGPKHDGRRGVLGEGSDGEVEKPSWE